MELLKEHMENNVHELKKATTTEAAPMKLIGIQITFTDEVAHFEAVEYYTVSNGFLVVKPKDGHQVAYNAANVFSIQELEPKEVN